MTLAPAFVLLSDSDTDAPALLGIATVSKEHSHPEWDNGGWEMGRIAALAGKLWVDRPYWAGGGDLDWLVDRCMAITTLGGMCQAGNEQNIPLEGWDGGPDGWDVFWNHLNAAYPSGNWLAMPPSPGVSGWQEWVTRNAPRLAVHAYGTLAEMWSIVQWYLDNTSGDLYITECNFAAGREADRNQWAVEHLVPFLDRCSQHSRIKMVAYFAWRWDQSSTLPTPVDGRGTAIEQVLQAWQSQEPAMTLADAAFAEMEQIQLRITPTFALPKAILQENTRLGDTGSGYDIITPEHRFNYEGRRYAMLGAQRIRDEAKLIAIAPDGNWNEVQLFRRPDTILPPLIYKPTDPSPNWHARPEPISGIVLHHTGGSLTSTLNHFNDPASDASSHYVIDRNGDIYTPVPLAKAAWHVGKSRAPTGEEWLNDFTIGYELVNNGDGEPYPDAQLNALMQLMVLDVARYPAITRNRVWEHGKVRDAWNEAHPDNPGHWRNDPYGLNVAAILNAVFGG